MSSCAKREPESPYKKTKPVTPGADATVYVLCLHKSCPNTRHKLLYTVLYT